MRSAASDEAPHREADDREEVYNEGSPRLRDNLSHVVLLTFLGILFVLSPVLPPNLFLTASPTPASSWPPSSSASSPSNDNAG